MSILDVRRWALTALLAAFTLPVLAQGSGRPIRLVIPFAPGGAQDVIGRYLGDKLAARLGATVVIDNRAGAGGALAADAVAKAAPDGQTLLLASGGAISIAPHLNPRLPYDAKKDFAAVALVGDTPMTIAVRADSPYKALADVLRDARARPGALAYASTGNATVSHLTGELLAQSAGVKLLHVPYKGAAPALNDLLGGQVPLIVTSAASVDAMVEAGKVRVLATFSKAHLPNLLDRPTVAEAAGIAGLEVPVWVGVLAPAGTPAERLNALAAELMAICRLPETQERFKGLGAVPACGDRAALEKMIGDDSARWAGVIRQGSIKLE
ncbi:MAG: tripartite tricarboxylate transporter substrate binding protein [Rubrivivax sp.]